MHVTMHVLFSCPFMWQGASAIVYCGALRPTVRHPGVKVEEAIRDMAAVSKLVIDLDS